MENNKAYDYNNEEYDYNNGAYDYNNRPYAQSFVIYQQPGGDVYEPMEALKYGTIFPALNIPYTFWRFGNGQK